MRPTPHLHRQVAAALLTIAAALALPARADDTQPPIKVFVLEPQVGGVAGVDAGAVEAVLTQRIGRLQKLERFSFLGRAEAAETLKAIQLRQLTGEDGDEEMLTRLGEALAVDRVIATVVGTVGSSNVVSITLLDVKAAKAEKRLSRVVRGDKQFILTGANECADELLAYLVQKYTNLLANKAPARSHVTSPTGRYAGWALVGAGAGIAGTALVIGGMNGTGSGDLVVPVGIGAVVAIAGGLVMLISDGPHVEGSGDSEPGWVVVPAAGNDGAGVVIARRF